MKNRDFTDYILLTRETGSITKAAKEIGISQPALSSAISQTEKRLGFFIFNKKTSPLSLTPAGVKYCEYLESKKRQELCFEKEIAEILDEENSCVTVGAPTVYIRSVVLPAITALMKLHPSYKVKIENTSVPELISQTREGKTDCFISTSEIFPDEFENEFIKKERIYLCVHSKDVLNEKIKCCLKESGRFDPMLLDGQNFIFLGENQPLQSVVNSLMEDYKIDIRYRITVDQINTALMMVSEGMGSCLATEESAKYIGEDENIEAYDLSEIVKPRNIYVSHLKDTFLPEACVQLIKILKEKEHESK